MVAVAVVVSVAVGVGVVVVVVVVVAVVVSVAVSVEVVVAVWSVTGSTVASSSSHELLIVPVDSGIPLSSRAIAR